MKSKFMYSLLVSSFLIFSCEGPEGPQGPAGKDGINGKDGAAGATGQQGPVGPAGQNGNDATSNVKSTGWFKPDFSDADITNNNSIKDESGKVYQTYVSMVLKDKSQPLITQEVIDNGVILIYFKTKTLVYDQSESEYYLEDAIYGGLTNVGSNSYFKIPGRELSKNEDFVPIYYSVQNMKINEWSIYANLSTPFVNSYINGTYVYTSRAPELLNKNNTFYRELFSDNALEIRLVTMTSTVAGRLKNIDFSNYDTVKKALNLTD